MMIRTVKVYSTVGASGAIETNVTTLGELKPLLAQKGIDYSGMKMLVGETRNELSVDEATLPEGDFKLYLMPKKTKSGGNARIADLFDTLSDTYASLSAEFESLADSPISGAATKTFSQSAEDAEAMADLQRLNGQG